MIKTNRVLSKVYDSLMFRMNYLIKARSFRNMLLVQQEHLKSGLWRYRGGSLWSHTGAAVPAHIMSSKGAGSEGQYRGFLRTAYFLAWRLVGELVNFPVWVKRGRSDGAEMSIGAAQGEFLILNPKEGWIYRVVSKRDYSRSYVENRKRYENYILSPCFEVRQDGTVLKEEFLDGVNLRQLSAPNQETCAKQLLYAFSTMAANEAEGTSVEFMDAVLAMTRRAKIPPSLHAYLHDDGFFEQVRLWPLLPSHGDLFADNVLVQQGQPYVIDWDAQRTGLKPFWYDPLTLFLNDAWSQESRGDLLRKYFQGAFDGEIRALLCAADAVVPEAFSQAQCRLRLAAVWAVAFAYGNASRKSHPEEIFKKEVAISWQRIEEYYSRYSA